MTLNPFAWERTTERVARAEDTLRGGNFQCLECGAALILRRGEVRVAHFAHHHEDGERKCGGGAPESWQHLQAKDLIRDFLPQWRFIAQCPVCQCEEQAQSFTGCTVALEQKCDKYRPDAIIWRDGDRVATVEVYHTHRTGEEKAAHFAAINLMMMEVVAMDVIDQHASGSYRLRYSGPKCCKCQELEAYRAVHRCCIQCNQWEAKELVVDGRCPVCHDAHTLSVFQLQHTLCHRCKDWRPNGMCLFGRCLSCRQAYPNETCCNRCEKWKVGELCVEGLCSRCRKRPCHACGKWSLRETLLLIAPPHGHKFPDAFLCNGCAMKCDGCTEWMPRHRGNRLCDACYGEASLVRIRQKEVSDRLEREALHDQTVLCHWREECATALLNPRITVLQTLIASRPQGEPVDVLETTLQNAQRIEANVRAKFARLRETGLVNVKRKAHVLTPEAHHKNDSERTDMPKRFCTNK